MIKTPTTNEAADRLRAEMEFEWNMPSVVVRDFDAALAEERRLVLAQVRDRLRTAPRDEGPSVDRGSRFYVEVLRILDEMGDG